MTKSATPEKAEPARLGRKPVAVEDRAVVGSVRLKPAEWARFHALGGVAWLRERIRLARK